MNRAVVPIARTDDQLMLHAQELALRVGTTLADVQVIAWPGHTEESLVAAWDDYQPAVRALEALALGVMTWQQFYDDDTCRDQAHAIELKQTEVDDAFQVLVHGPRGAKAIKCWHCDRTDSLDSYGYCPDHKGALV